MNKHQPGSILLAWGLGVALLAAGCGTPKHVTNVAPIQQPPPGKALINFHRPSKMGGTTHYAIMDRDGKMLVDIGGASKFQLVCDPGEHVFMGWADHVSVVKADVAPDKIYDIIVDIGMGWVKANIRMTPLTKSEPRRAKLAEFEKREKRVVGLQRNEHVTKWEEANRQRVAEIQRDFLGGEKKDRVLLLQRDDCR